MNRLKELREEAMMTVRELSKRSGVSEDTITKIENGHRKGRSMTLRKLAKALGVRPYQLSPEQFERTSRAEKSAREILPQEGLFDSEMVNVNPPEDEIEQSAEKLPPQRRFADGVPRMSLSERQQRVLITVLECGEVEPSTVAERLAISVSTAYRDLSILEEHGLIVVEESGKRVISPLGKDLVEAIASTRPKLYYDEALNHIAALMREYESVAGFDPRRATDEEAASFFLLQESTVQSIRRIVATAEPSPLVKERQTNV